MENTELEKWVREQTERLGELRRLLCSSGKPELEQYLAQAVVQPFFYYRKNGNGNEGSRMTLVLVKFVDEPLENELHATVVISILSVMEERLSQSGCTILFEHRLSKCATESIFRTPRDYSHLRCSCSLYWFTFTQINL